MKTIFLIFIILITLSCQDKKQEVEVKKTEFYYLPCFQNHKSQDTANYEDYNHVDPDDSLLASEVFKYKEQYHRINMYTSDYHANIDGGGLSYTLDSLGVIYSRATSWPSFGRLASNNDSINDLITTALGFIISKSSLRCYNCSDKYTHIP